MVPLTPLQRARQLLEIAGDALDQLPPGIVDGDGYATELADELQRILEAWDVFHRFGIDPKTLAPKP